MINALLSVILSILSILGLNGSFLHLAPKPCAEPIKYSIGSFDRRFGVSYDDFLSALKEAEAVWEKPSGRDLFQYSPTDGSLKVDLIYDNRQQVTQELGQIETSVSSDKTTYDKLESEYQSLKSQYSAAKAAYDRDVLIFNTENAKYAQMVSDWNSGPRTSRSQFNDLEAERQKLQASADQIKSEESGLNQLADQVNSVVSELNPLAQKLNLKVDQYNTIGASRGDTFTGGLYTEDASGQRIDIFEFDDHAKLVRVLAHELGHALGLEHVSDPNAIMYYLNQSSAEKPTQADLDALNALCGASGVK